LKPGSSKPESPENCEPSKIMLQTGQKEKGIKTQKNPKTNYVIHFIIGHEYHAKLNEESKRPVTRIQVCTT